MRRPLLAASLTGLLFAVACISDRNPVSVEPPAFDVTSLFPLCDAELATTINSEIASLYPNTPTLRGAASTRFRMVQRQCPKNLADARNQAIALAGFAAQKFQNHQLLSTATAHAVSVHIDHLYQYVGLTGPAIPDDGLGPDGAVAVVGPTGGLVTTPSKLAGVDFPAGALNSNVLVTINRDPNQTNPLPTDRQQFPLFYDYATFPTVERFNLPVVVGLCVLDEFVTVPFANLRLAHPDPSDATVIEILRLADAPFVDPTACANATLDGETIGSLDGPSSALATTGVKALGKRLAEFTLGLFSARPLHAAAVVMPGGLGGQTHSFSPFGAVDAGNILTQFIPTGATGNGRGMAFDGQNLYYTIVGDAHIYKINSFGTPLATIATPTVSGAQPQGGPLAWDGANLWTINYGTEGDLIRLTPSGTLVSTCNIFAANPEESAFSSFIRPSDHIDFEDGLDWTGIPGSELVMSGEVFPGTSVLFLNPSCVIQSAFTAPTTSGAGGFTGSFGVSGNAFDGVDLWHSNAHGLQFQTTTAGVQTDVQFVSPHLQVEDLAFDAVTFAPKCALWGNEAAGKNRITAFQVPCRVSPD